VNRVQRKGWKGGRGWALRIGGLLAAASLLWLQAGCEPRKIEPERIDRVVAAVAAETQYRRVELPNGLKVMLISDASAERSAASLAVGAGSLNDPKDRPGLAHFLEHMLFLGTEKYPEPEGYQQFVNQHAGFTNAYTADDHTNFFFQVGHEAFPEALDRFAQFFIAPLFTPGYVAREMNAVDSEHSKNVENDQWRVTQVIRDAFDPGHPIRRFATGNLETLRGVSREELLDFYRGHYSANLMTLAVISNRELDELEMLVREHFAKVENRRLERAHYPEVFLAPEPALRLLTVEPVADQRSLILTFPLPPTSALYETKPLQLLSFVLGHEGPGSLLSLLKAKHLASSLAAGSGEGTEDYSSLDLRIGLTPEGLQRYEEVLSDVFGAIRYFRSHGFPHHVFEESQIMAELDFRYQPKDDAASRATGMSALMQTIPMESLPEGVYLYRRFDPAEVTRFLDRLTPDNVLVTLVAKGVPANKTEPYYQARYGYEKRTGKEYRRLVAAAPDARIRWPEPNPFIPHLAGPRRPEGPLKWAYTSQLHLRRDGVPAEVVSRMERYQDVSFTGLRAFLTEMEGIVPPAEQEAVLPVLLQDALPLPVRLMDDARGKVWFCPTGASASLARR
jgi:insulysin